ncbi:MAG: ACP S-malonyltransferase [Flavobacteriales bacterium]
MKAYVFPGQGSQFPGMAHKLYTDSEAVRNLLEQANEILGFRITDIMFSGSEDDLKQTRVTQPAIFLHSMAALHTLPSDPPKMTAGHSLGEFSALVAAQALDFETALKLVALRSAAMQKACEAHPSTMAAVLGLEDAIIENICNDISGIVVAANYNCPGQLVISGELKAIEEACVKLLAAGAKRALQLQVGGAFHSPLMEPARIELEQAIAQAHFQTPICPIYQNVNAKAVTDPSEIKQNLVAQLTAPVRWTQTMQAMISDGCNEVIEVGPGKVLQGLFKKVQRDILCSSATEN